MILVSSCLAGLQVRYNGTHSLDLKISKLIVENKAIPVCPELLGGFSTPREPAEIIGGNGEMYWMGNQMSHSFWHLKEEFFERFLLLKVSGSSCLKCM